MCVCIYIYIYIHIYILIYILGYTKISGYTQISWYSPTSRYTPISGYIPISGYTHPTPNPAPPSQILQGLGAMFEHNTHVFQDFVNPTYIYIHTYTMYP